MISSPLQTLVLKKLTFFLEYLKLFIEFEFYISYSALSLVFWRNKVFGWEQEEDIYFCDDRAGDRIDLSNR